jgi:hypothetical protein
MGSRLLRARRVALYLGLALGGYAALGAGLLPWAVRRWGTRWLATTLGRPVTVRGLSVNPFALSVRVAGFSVGRQAVPLPGEPDVLVGFDALYVDAELRSLFDGGPVLRSIRLRGPQVHIVQTADGRDNLADVLASVQRAFPGPSAPRSQPPRFSLNNIELDGGRATWLDGPHGVRHTVEDVALKIPFLSNLPVYVRTYVVPRFSARVDGTELALAGRALPFSETQESRIELRLRALDLRRLVPYQPAALRCGLQSGILDGILRVTFANRRVRLGGDGAAPTVSIDGELSLSNLKTVDGEGQPLVSWSRLRVDVRSFEPLARRVVLRRVLLEAPEVALGFNRRGSLNFSRLMADGPAAGHPPPAEGVDRNAPPPSPLVLVVEQAELARGRLRYFDDRGPLPLSTQLSEVEMSIADYVRGGSRPAAVKLALRSDLDEVVRLEAKVALSPLSADGRAELGGLVLSRYTPYFARALRARAPSGRLSVAAQVHLALPPGSAPLVLTLSAIEGELADVRLVALRGGRSPAGARAQPVPFLVLPRLTVSGGSLDLLRRRLHVDELASTGGRLRVERDGTGRIDVATLTATSSAPGGSASTTAGAGRAEPPVEGVAAPPLPPAPSGPAWRFELGRLALDRWSVRWTDHVPAGGASSSEPPGEPRPHAPVVLSLDGLRTQLRNVVFPSSSPLRLELSTKVNGRGSLRLTGSVGQLPPSADLRIQLDRLALLPFQPYVMSTSPVILTDGELSIQGRVVAAVPASGRPKASFSGEAALERVALLDKAAHEELLRWRALHLDGVAVTVAPPRPLELTVGQVAMAGLDGAVVVRPDGTLNLTSGLSSAEKSAPAAPQPPGPSDEGAGPKIRVQRVAVEDAAIKLTDRSVSPPFSISVGSLRSTLTGLSSEPGTKASLELSAKLEGAAPVAVAGTMNPLAKTPHLDVGVQLSELELPPVSPYSGKFVGYRIDKGKLALDLRYKIADRRLEAQNRVFIDQLTFGDEVESPTATKLPVRLAVALLADRRGEIHLDVPVSGSLDDPEFSVWRIVWQVIKNVMVKAATSPFALIGSMFGGGDEIRAVEFVPGKAVPTAAGERALATLGRALTERPRLRVDLEGHVDPRADRQGLREELAERRIRVQKLRQLTADGQAVSGVDKVVVEPAERETFLRRAYEAEPMGKPKNLLGRPKSVGSDEMWRRLLQAMVVTDGELRLLALQRAEGVKRLLLTKHRIASERLFLVEPKQLAPTEQGDTRPLSGSRVDLALR